MTLLETATLSDGRLSVDVLPSRGLDIGGARFEGRRFSWELPDRPRPVAGKLQPAPSAADWW